MRAARPILGPGVRPHHLPCANTAQEFLAKLWLIHLAFNVPTGEGGKAKIDDRGHLELINVEL